MSEAASRVSALLDDDGSTDLADYSYLGRGMFVETDYTEPGTAGGDDPDTGDISLLRKACGISILPHTGGKRGYVQ
jgi:hypothetical protein